MATQRQSRPMELPRVTRFLEARYTSSLDEVALCNLAYGTRLLAQPDSWDKLRGFELPSVLTPEDSWLERARDAHVLVSEGDPVPDFVVRLRHSLERYLGQFDQSAAGASDLELLERAEALYRRHHMPAPFQGDPLKAGPLMKRPERLVDFIFDHTRAFLSHDLNGDREGVDVEMVRQFSQRPAMKLRYEQQFCTPHTSQLRAAELLRALAPGGRILVLGDDDLVSLALLRQNPELQVDTLELDVDLVAFLKQHGGERLRVLECDLRQGVPEAMKGAYQLVTTDPPYAANGMRFFLECARASLAPGPESRLFLTTYPGLIESPERLWRDLEELQLILHQQKPHFSRYIYNNNYRVEHLACMRHLGCPLHPTTELIGFPFLYAHFFEIGWKA